jgi:hypothetical protein
LLFLIFWNSIKIFNRWFLKSKVNHFFMCFNFWIMMKTRAKVVHNKKSQGCNWIIKSEKGTGWSKKSFWCDLEEKCLRNSKIFFMESFSFFVPFLFLLKGNSYSSLVLKFQVFKLKIAIEVTKLSICPQKCVFLKCL